MPVTSSSATLAVNGDNEQANETVQQNTAQSGTQQQAGPSGLQSSSAAEVDGVRVPEGVDQSFLDALPEDIR